MVSGEAGHVTDPTIVAEIAALWAQGGNSRRSRTTREPASPHRSTAPTLGPPPWFVYEVRPAYRDRSRHRRGDAGFNALAVLSSEPGGGAGRGSFVKEGTRAWMFNERDESSAGCSSAHSSRASRQSLLFVNGLGATWSDMRFVPGDTSVNSLKLGAVLEFGLIVTQIGTAVVIYPLVRRQSEIVSLGYVTARTMESVFASDRAARREHHCPLWVWRTRWRQRLAPTPQRSPFKATP